jgi:hypothetical protein
MALEMNRNKGDSKWDKVPVFTRVDISASSVVDAHNNVQSPDEQVVNEHSTST